MWRNATVFIRGPRVNKAASTHSSGVIPCSLAYRSIWLAWSGVMIQAGRSMVFFLRVVGVRP